MCNFCSLFGEYVTMRVMRRFALFIFAFIFAFNTISLAYASACPMVLETKTQVQAQDPECHDMEEMQDDMQGKTTQCEDICLCMAVLLNSSALPINDQAVYEDTRVRTQFYAVTHHYSYDRAVLLRPPISIS